MSLTGGITQKDEPVTPEVHSLVHQVKDQIVGKANASYDIFEPLSFRTQVVAGRNYFVKVGNFIMRNVAMVPELSNCCTDPCR